MVGDHGLFCSPGGIILQRSAPVNFACSTGMGCVASPPRQWHLGVQSAALPQCLSYFSCHFQAMILPWKEKNRKDYIFLFIYIYGVFYGFFCCVAFFFFFFSSSAAS